MKNYHFLWMLVGILVMGCQAQKETPKERTETGYEYVHHIKNQGTKPQVGDEVSYHQSVYLNDSLIFSTYETGRMIKGVLPSRDQLPVPIRPDFEGVFLMSEGDSMTLYQPLDTIQNLPPQFKKEDVLVYSISLKKIKSKEEVQKEQEALKARESEVAKATNELIEKYKAGKLGSELITTESGLKYIIHEKGTGKQPTVANYVQVNYYGCLTNEKMFDNSFGRGEPAGFQVGQVIAGWQEGLSLMQEGAKATFFIPYELGYGEAGNPPDIPGKSELVFYVELLEVL